MNTIRLLLVILVLIPGCLGEEKKEEQPYRIGILQMTEVLDISVQGFKDGMKELGYAEGKSVVYDYRNANGDVQKLREHAQYFADEEVDLIFSLTTIATKVARDASNGTGIPIVFTPVMEPVRSGLVESIESPGGRITGVSAMVLASKQLEILLEAKPNIRTLGFISSFDHMGVIEQLREAARNNNITMVEYRVEKVSEVPLAAKAVSEKSDAIYVPPDNIVTKDMGSIIAAAKEEKIPLMVPLEIGVKKGAFLSYAADYYELGKTASQMTDKILKGTPPKDVPVEFPIRPKLVINLDTARAIGLEVPSELLYRANKVVGG
jgi:putative ABC transport system substrate-binding protein